MKDEWDADDEADDLPQEMDCYEDEDEHKDSSGERRDYSIPPGPIIAGPSRTSQVESESEECTNTDDDSSTSGDVPTPDIVTLARTSRGCGCQTCVTQTLNLQNITLSERLEKLEAYREWREQRRRRTLEEQARRKSEAIDGALPIRERAMQVVALALNIDADELKAWDAESLGGWRKKLEQDYDQGIFPTPPEYDTD